METIMETDKIKSKKSGNTYTLMLAKDDFGFLIRMTVHYSVSAKSTWHRYERLDEALVDYHRAIGQIIA